MQLHEAQRKANEVINLAKAAGGKPAAMIIYPNNDTWVMLKFDDEERSGAFMSHLMDVDLGITQALLSNQKVAVMM